MAENTKMDSRYDVEGADAVPLIMITPSVLVEWHIPNLNIKKYYTNFEL